MPFPIQWQAVRENGVIVENSPLSPLSGAYSLHMGSSGTEWDVTDPGLRKSASIFIKNGQADRGYTNGRIRTLIRRNSTNQSNAWGGVFIISEIEGIGTRIVPGQNRYEITDKDGSIKIIKYTGAIPTILFNTGQNFTQNTLYGFDVTWAYDSLTTSLNIKVRLGLLDDFSDLLVIANYTDSINPHTVSETEGFFVQADSHDDFLSYNFDKTSFFTLAHL